MSDVVLPAESRYLRLACEELGYSFRDLSGDGYLMEIGDGRRTIPLAAGRACIYPTNTAAAAAICRDKMHTNRLLEVHGIATLGGALFFVTDYYRRYRGAGREQSDALAYAAELGYPVFVKPNTGARGDLAEIVADEGQLRAYLDHAARLYDAVIVQRVFHGPEFRILCLGGEVIAGVQRASGQLVGDGRASLRGLITEYNRSLAGLGVSGISEGTASQIAGEYADGLDRPVPEGRRITLPGRRNLMVSGRVERIMDDVPAGLAAIARQATAVAGLHLAGVDVMDTSAGPDAVISSAGSQLRVLELNGTPGLTAFEQAGRMDVVIEVWRRVLARAFATPGPEQPDPEDP